MSQHFMSEEREMEYLHDAFISYSRKDKSFASLIEKALESYAPPKDIPIPQRRLDIIRDEEDFTGAEYYTTLNKHLRTSRKLILICSPAARSSRYVDEEIKTFAVANGADNIIPILLEGVPNNEASLELVTEMAFPKALVENMEMPLTISYLNFKPGEDKINKGIYANSWFSVLADIYDISRSDIEQREKRRQARILKVRISVIVLVMISLLAFSLWALWERNIAEKQRKVALSRQLVAQSFLNDVSHLDRAMLLSLAARQVMDTAETQDSLLRAIQLLPRRLNFLRGHKRGRVFTIAFSPDGKTLASGSSDNTVILWDVASRKPVGRPLSMHKSTVFCVAFSPDGKILASGDGEGTINLWDLATRQPMGAPLVEHRGRVTSLAFSPDGKMLASEDGYGTVILWDMLRRQPIGAPLAGQKSQVWSIAFSPDGKTLALGNEDGTVILWDVTLRKPFGQPFSSHQGGARSVAFSPDGKILASGGYRGTVILWDVATRKPLGEPLDMHKGAVLDLVFSPDGKTLASGSSIDNTVILWDIARRLAPKPKWFTLGMLASYAPVDSPLAVHQDSVWSVSFSPDGKTLASGSEDGTVILWDLTGRSPLDIALFAGHKNAVTGVAFSPDGQSVVSGSIDETVIQWEVATSQPLGTPLAVGHQGQERGVAVKVAFSPDGKILATGRGYASWRVVDDQGEPDASDASTTGTVILWDMATGQPLKRLSGHKDAVTSVTFSPDGKTFASGSYDGTIILWDVASWKTQGKTADRNEKPVTSIAFSPDGKTLASGSYDDNLILWDVVTQKQLGQPLSAHQGGVTSVAYSPDGKILASGGYEGTIILWDTTSRKTIGRPLVGHKDVVSSVAYSPDGKILASGSYDGTVILWNVASQKGLGKPFSGHRGGVSSVAYSPDGKTLASGSDDKTVILWYVDTKEWEQLACQIVNRNLTHKEWNDYVGDAIAYLPVCPNLPIPEE
jgi:WD40 repeat protein